MEGMVGGGAQAEGVEDVDGGEVLWTANGR